MRKAPIPADEAPRIDALSALDILDTPPEERFDRLTRLARGLFDVPIALVSLVDEHRQWFKSRQGLDAPETPREISFCGHAIHEDGILLVEDARADERFHDNPLVAREPSIRFYAGCPLRGGTGYRLGTLCLIDRRPRRFGAEELSLLRDLAAMVDRELAVVQLATLDELTGLSNRRGFELLAERAIGICQRSERPVTLLFVDLDEFKQINDQLGHERGDAALADFGRLLLESFRDSDIVARLGGDEFCVLLTNAGTDGIDRPLRELGVRLDAWNLGSPLPLRFSLGSASIAPGARTTLADLMREADQRMYDQKRAGRRK